MSISHDSFERFCPHLLVPLPHSCRNLPSSMEVLSSVCQCLYPTCTREGFLTFFLLSPPLLSLFVPWLSPNILSHHLSTFKLWQGNLHSSINRVPLCLSLSSHIAVRESTYTRFTLLPPLPPFLSLWSHLLVPLPCSCLNLPFSLESLSSLCLHRSFEKRLHFLTPHFPFAHCRTSLTCPTFFLSPSVPNPCPSTLQLSDPDVQNG